MTQGGRRRQVLVVDDDQSYRDALATGLKSEGFLVNLAADGRGALRKFHDDPPDVILLDLRLPDIAGTELCRQMREASDVPILMLSAVAEEVDVVLSLELGADDYIAKPFRLRELVARIDTATRLRERVRRAEGVPRPISEPVEIGPYRIDFVARTVERRGERVELARKEFDLLAHLARSPGRVFSRDELVDEVWGGNLVDDRTLNTHMYRLRNKLEDDPTHPIWIIVVRGVGYLLNDGRRLRALNGATPGSEDQPNRPLT